MKKTKIQMVDISRLQLNRGQIKWLPRNPRQWTQADIDKMTRSLERDPDFVEERPVLATPGKGDALVVFAHNLLTESASRAGRDALPAVIYTPENEDDRETIRRRALLDNGAMGRNDTDILANEWPYTAEELVDFGYADYTGETEKPAPATAQAQEDDFDETADAVEQRCKTGDIWQLGNHRLMCGDSTDAAQVALLMNGEKADMCFTDPPYGVEYTGGIQFKSDGTAEHNNREMITNDDKDLYADVFPVLRDFVDGPCYVWFAGTKAASLYKAAEEYGEIHALIIWVKNGGYGALMANYKQKHEPCLYWKPKNAKLKFCGATTETTIWEIAKDGVNEYHPTQNPVALPAKAIGNHDADSVLDLFGGSGSTLIAAEQLGRRCFMMELDPHFCDVILARWEKLTGQTARKLD